MLYRESAIDRRLDNNRRRIVFVLRHIVFYGRRAEKKVRALDFSVRCALSSLHRVEFFFPRVEFFFSGDFFSVRRTSMTDLSVLKRLFAHSFDRHRELSNVLGVRDPQKEGKKVTDAERGATAA